jgi:hypothetical protein
MYYHPDFKNGSPNTPTIFRNYTLKVDSEFLETYLQIPPHTFF